MQIATLDTFKGIYNRGKKFANFESGYFSLIGEPHGSIFTVSLAGYHEYYVNSGPVFYCPIYEDAPDDVIEYCYESYKNWMLLNAQDLAPSIDEK